MYLDLCEILQYVLSSYLWENKENLWTKNIFTCTCASIRSVFKEINKTLNSHFIMWLEGGFDYQ